MLYNNQYMRIKWGDSISRTFGVTNGVKQGGVLSHILFGIYLDELLLRLKETKLGCHIGNLFLGALAYADDIILLAPTRRTLKAMLNIVRQCSVDYNISFNPDKSKLLHFCKQNNIEMQFLFNGTCIHSCNKTTHLGNELGSGKELKSLKNVINDLMLMSHFRVLAWLTYKV
jgi:hypothetical protein